MTTYRKEFLKMTAMAAMGAMVSFDGGAMARPLEDVQKDWGVVCVSVCNMRLSGDYNAGQSSQALLGMPVKILHHDNWLEVMTPDEYTGWVLPRFVKLMTREELTHWNTSEQVVVTSIYAFVYSEPFRKSQTVSDVVAGDRLQLIGRHGNYFHVAYPDGRTGYIRRADCEELTSWRKHLKNDAESIIATAKRLIGVPYMWGGTSTKGVDCSGFVRTTLFQHDIIIPRDASQMAYKGLHLVIEPDFSNLRPGDLLFFGRVDEDSTTHVSHVGIYIGERRFIHSLGWVHISSFNPEDKEYDEYDLNRILWAQRVLPYINQERGLNTTEYNEFYK